MPGGYGMIMDWAKITKDVRERLSLTQTELAKKLGVCYASVNRWEQGHHEPTMKERRKLAEICRELGMYNLNDEDKDDDDRDEEIMRFIHTLMDNIPWNKLNDERIHIWDMKNDKDCGTLKEYINERMKTLFGVIVKYGEEKKE